MGGLFLAGGHNSHFEGLARRRSTGSRPLILILGGFGLPAAIAVAPPWQFCGLLNNQ
jgi:hypothetical protein